MSTVTLQLPPQTEEKLREKARFHGESLEAYVSRLIVYLADSSLFQALDETVAPAPIGTPDDLAEFDRILDEFAADSADLPVLPKDFSRADIYGDHD